jgi:subtilase family serine protease
MSLHFSKPRLAAVAVAAVCLCWTAVASAGSGNGHVSPAALPAPVPCIFGAAPPACFGPFEFTRAYNFPAGLDGSGQTIVILTPYGDPTLQSDVDTFSAFFGLPSTNVTVIPVAGSGAAGSGQLQFWAIETALDVEYAHALAPGAKIVVAQAATDDNSDLVLAAAKVLPRYPGAVVSMSFGDFETDSTAGTFVKQMHAVFLLATALRETLVAASGDLGATFTPLTGGDTPVAGYPAADPLVTAVGGTMPLQGPGALLVNGAYGGEQVWNEPPGASGGAPSVLFRAPSWQRPVTSYKTRTVPDVAFNAESAGGATVFALGRPGLVGGTSVGAPAWAAIFALVNQARAAAGRGPIGLANDNLYKLGRKSPGDFHDVTVGNNAFLSPTGFPATPGYDLATGWGTPNVAALVADLTKAAPGSFNRGDDDGDAGNGNGNHGNGNRGNDRGRNGHTVFVGTGGNTEAD